MGGMQTICRRERQSPHPTSPHHTHCLSLTCLSSSLQLPQEVLTDRQIRREVVPGLPLHRVCQLLERFEPDDCAPDPLPPGEWGRWHAVGRRCG